MYYFAAFKSLALSTVQLFARCTIYDYVQIICYIFVCSKCRSDSLLFGLDYIAPALSCGIFHHCKRHIRLETGLSNNGPT